MKWLNTHQVLVSLLVSILGGVVWVLTTYATVEYVDKGRTEDRMMLKEMRDDIKVLLTRKR